jgi:hypothetical protein
LLDEAPLLQHAASGLFAAHFSGLTVTCGNVMPSLACTVTGRLTVRSGTESLGQCPLRIR